MNRLLLLAVTILTLNAFSAHASESFTSNGAASDTLTDFAALPKVRGQIRQVYPANGTLKIKHEAIPNLDMPAMTMTFKVADSRMMNGLVNGDRIQFSATDEGGVLTVVWIEKRN